MQHYSFTFEASISTMLYTAWNHQRVFLWIMKILIFCHLKKHHEIFEGFFIFILFSSILSGSYDGNVYVWDFNGNF